MQTIRQAEHLLNVTTERSLYKGALDKAKSSIVTHFSSNGEFSPPSPGAKRAFNGTPIEAHYSFDMAQHVFYPNDPLQPGPMYFLRQGSVLSLGCAVRPSHVRLIT